MTRLPRQNLAGRKKPTIVRLHKSNPAISGKIRLQEEILAAVTVHLPCFSRIFPVIIFLAIPGHCSSRKEAPPRTIHESMSTWSCLEHHFPFRQPYGLSIDTRLDIDLEGLFGNLLPGEDLDEALPPLTTTLRQEERRFGFQLMTGLSLRVLQRVELRAGYRYRSGRDGPVNSDQVEGGVRFRFRRIEPGTLPDQDRPSAVARFLRRLSPKFHGKLTGKNTCKEVILPYNRGKKASNL